MSVLSDVEIIDAIISGRIVCRPFRPENVRGASIDLTLGKVFWRCDANPHGVLNPYDEDEIVRYFAGPFEAKPYEAVYEKLAAESPKNRWPLPGGHPACPRNDWSRSKSPFRGISDDWPVIVFRPFERLLGCTHEFVGIDNTGTSQLHARSSTGRIGIKVCDDAGLGDPGWIGRWTKEMRNDNREATVLPVGERLSQINFFDLGVPARESYGTEKLYKSKYQRGDDVDEIIAKWKPEDMLPRNYKDKRVPLGDLTREAFDVEVDKIVYERGSIESARVAAAMRAGSDSVL